MREITPKYAKKMHNIIQKDKELSKVKISAGNLKFSVGNTE